MKIENSNTMTQIEVLNGFESLSPKQQLTVAKKIQTKMSDELFADLDMELPDIDMSESEIMKEVKAVRTLEETFEEKHQKANEFIKKVKISF
jgi:hypothetical protein